MSENNLKQIYADPTFYNIVRILREGPLLEGTVIKYLLTALKQNDKPAALKIIEKLEKEKIIISFQHNEEKYYLLVKDFLIIRVPPKETIEYVQKKKDLPAIVREKFLMIVKKYFKTYISSKEANSEIESNLVSILVNPIFFNIINLLKKKPVTLEEFQKTCLDFQKAKEILLQYDIIEIISEGNEKKSNWVVLKSNLHFQFFFPEYLIKKITEKLNEKKIDKEMAIKTLYMLKYKYLEFEKPKQFKEITNKIKNKLEIITSLVKKGENPKNKAKELKELYVLIGDYENIELWNKKLSKWQ